jgi:hypothetical protein
MEQIIRTKIQSIINNYTLNENSIYLLHPINDQSAFFFQKDKVVFGQHVGYSTEKPQINTAFLSMYLCVSISGITNNTTYPTGQYNLLTYNGSLEDENFSSFVDLCTIFAETSGVKFDDFFYSMIDIFQLPSTAKELNLIGFFGELSLIIELWEKYRIDLSDIWHVEGSKSRYDFTSPNFNIEIKSTIRESSIFRIKHSQIFNRHNNYMVIIKLKDGFGQSLGDLIEYCKQEQPFCKNLNFQIKLQEERLKVDPIKLKSKKYTISRISVFKKNQLITINEIPDCITEISYDYNFDFRIAYELDDVVIEFDRIVAIDRNK